MSGAAQSGQMSASAGSGQTYDGCVKEKHGKYMLMTMDGQKYMLNSTQDLSAHKGHEVKVTGDVSSGTAMSGGAMSGNDKGSNMQTLNVTNLDMVSNSCNMKKGNMSHDSGMSGSNPNNPK